MLRKFTIVLALAGITSTAVATDFYAGIKTGNVLHWINSTRYQESVVGTGIFVGYSFNPNVAVEVEAINLGSLVSGAATVSAANLSIVGVHHANEQVSLFAKLGMVNSKEDVSGIVANHTGISIGGGAQYDFNPSFGMRLAYDYYPYGGENNLSSASASWYSIAALFKF